MHKIRKAKLFTFALLTGALAASASTPAYADTFVSEGGTNLADIIVADAEAIPIVVYVYIEDDADNPYNNSGRDVNVELGGNGDYYIGGKSYHVLSDSLYVDYGIIRMISNLPPDFGNLYPTLYTSDVKAPESISYLFSLNNDSPIEANYESAVTASDLQNGLNEFYFVGSYDSTWVTAHGQEKLSEMYHLLHSQSGELGGSRFEQASASDALFRYWQQEMIADSTITGWQDEDGTIYSREDMNTLGYPVDKADAGASTSDADAVAVEDKVQESAEVDASQNILETPQPETEAATIPDTSVATRRSGVQPIVIVIIGIACAIAAAVIAYIRRERNESDLYID